MGYTPTMAEATALFEKKCSVRISQCGGGVNNGKNRAELRFEPTQETIKTEFDASEEVAWKAAFAHLANFQTAGETEQLTSENAALQARIAELQAQLAERSDPSEQPTADIEQPKPRGRQKKAEQPTAA